MPYYIFKVTTFPFKQFELLGERASFKEAGAHAKDLRRAMTPADQYAIKVMFGDNQLQAEDILNQEREPQPRTGEDF